MKKLLLVLDLDETLVHASKSELERSPDFRVYQYFVYKRPELEEFISFCFNHFRVGVWTSSSPGYALKVVNQIFTGERPEFIFNSSRCTVRFDFELQTYYSVKKLKKLKKFAPLEKILMIDDTRRKHEDNYGNLIHIEEYNGEEKDQELYYLQKYLHKLRDMENIRHIEKRLWRQEVIDEIGED